TIHSQEKQVGRRRIASPHRLSNGQLQFPQTCEILPDGPSLLKHQMMFSPGSTDEDAEVDVVGSSSEGEVSYEEEMGEETEEGLMQQPAQPSTSNSENVPTSSLYSSSLMDSGGSGMNSTMTTRPASWVHTFYTNGVGQVTFTCLCQGCTWMSTEENEWARHLQEHADSASSSNHADPSSDQHNMFIPCPVVYCNRAFPAYPATEAMRCHMGFHAFHASLQKIGLAAVSSKEDLANMKHCGHPTKLRLNHNGDPMECMWDECEHLFIDHREFFKHALAHVDFVQSREKAVCGWEGCGKKFNNRASLRPHLRTHVGYKKAACPFCGEFFATMTKMYEHLSRRLKDSSNGNSETTMCKLCRKQFPNEKALRLHCKRHIMRVKCDECGVLFTTKYDLTRHQEVAHSDVTARLVCSTPDCTKTFTTNARLMQHLQLHMERDVVCAECGEKFRWVKQLTKHIHIKHNRAAMSHYMCHVCHKVYEDGSSLTRHLKSKHAQKTPIGFARFQYKKCADDYFRLQTKRHGQT
ncbi:hypothetical protein PFISCL1PPCAC_4754, partial [Pristionchus fissidentatus]